MKRIALSLALITATAMPAAAVVMAPLMPDAAVAVIKNSELFTLPCEDCVVPTPPSEETEETSPQE